MKGFNPALSISPLLRIPLWVMEGSAEYFSINWDTKADAFMRDLVINELLIPVSELGRYGGYIIYKEGQAIFHFIKEKYGIEKLGEFFHQLAMRKDLGAAIKGTFGMELEQFDEVFEREMKIKYYPTLERFQIPGAKEKVVTWHKRDGSFMNVGPTVSPDGRLIAFISDKTGYTDIYVTSTSAVGERRKIVSGQRNPSLENLHLLRPGLTFSPDGRYLAFVAQAGSQDVIHIFDMEKNKIVRTLTMRLNSIYTPSWSPKGRFLVLCGIEDGKSDIYLYDLESDRVRRLTNDRFDDRDPSFSPSGNRIVFVSDRNDGEGFQFGSYGLFEYNLDEDTIVPLFKGKGIISSPTYVSDTFVIFTAERNGSVNIYGYSIPEGRFYQITNYLTELTYPSYSQKRNIIAFSLLWKSGFDIFVIKNPLENMESIDLDDVPYLKVDTLFTSELKKRRYTLTFSVDWLAGAMEYSDVFGLYGALTVGLSDALGNHRISFTSDLYQDLVNSNFLLNYLYLPKRTDWGFSFYQYWDFYPITWDSVIVERRLGIEALALYPFDRFRRVEAGIGFARPHRYVLVYDEGLNAYDLVDDYTRSIFTFYLGFVIDKTLYGYYYPLDGYRIFVGGERAMPGLEYNLLWGDLRKYFRLGKRTILAFRFIGGYSWGPDRLTLWLGARPSFRGY
jgi:Tol biopolymer transport system component